MTAENVRQGTAGSVICTDVAYWSENKRLEVGTKMNVANVKQMRCERRLWLL